MTTTLVCFRSGDAAYAVPVERVREVRRGDVLIALPEAREGVAGILRYGDEALTVIAALGSGLAPDEVLVLSTPEHSFGLIVDEVTRVVTIAEDILPPPAGQENGYISGVLSAEEGLVLVVDVDALDDRLVA